MIVFNYCFAQDQRITVLSTGGQHKSYYKLICRAATLDGFQVLGGDGRIERAADTLGWVVPGAGRHR